MTDMTTPPAHRFTVGGALSFGVEVFRARPGAVLTLLIGHTLIYVVMAVGQFVLFGELARTGMQAVERGDAAEAYALSMQFSSASSLISLLGLPLWVWMEAVWLTLFMSGRFTLWPGWAGIGRLTVSGLILFGVYLAAFLALFFVIMIGIVFAMLAAESGTGDSAVTAFLVVIALCLIGGLGLVAILSVFSGLPAHALSGRFDIGGAIRAGRRHVVGLTLAWVLFLILYMLVMVVSYGAIAFSVGDQVANTFEMLLQNPEDPMITMRVYALLMPGVDQAWITALVLTPVMVSMGLVMMIGRGISAKLALSMPNPSEKAP